MFYFQEFGQYEINVGWIQKHLAKYLIGFVNSNKL